MRAASDAPEFVLRRAVPDDAAGIVACVESCYGDTYPKREFYDQALLARRISAREHEALVVYAGARLVAHMGWHRLSGNPNLAEAGTTVVAADVRTRPVPGVDRRAAADLGLERRIGEGTQALPPGPSHCSHLHDADRSIDGLSVRRIGSDLPALTRATTAEVHHVDLPMDDAAIGPATEALLTEGFVHGRLAALLRGHRRPSAAADTKPDPGHLLADAPLLTRPGTAGDDHERSG